MKRLRTTLTANSLCVRLCLFLVFFMVAPHSVAETQDVYKKDVELIGKEINKISRNLNANKALLKTEQDKLYELEKEISSTTASIRKIERAIKDLQDQNKQYDLQIVQLEQQQEKTKAEISDLIRTRYIHGRPNYIKMLLNQENPYAVGRLNHYYDYFSKARQIKIKQLRQQIMSYQELKAQKATGLAQLEKNKSEQLVQQKKLDQSKSQRKKTVDKLSSKVVASTKKLEQLKQDRDRLNRLLKQIALQAKKMRELEQKRLAEQKRLEQNNKKMDKPKKAIRPIVAGGFMKQKGRLRYPVQGQQKYKFGNRLAASGMLAEGVMFDTNGSVNVKSIFRGRVLFADFLKGYGLLLIVDHGDDHISLYGHNEVIYKKVGDMVETNEAIAKSGVTGGLKKPGTYFEIRKNTTPVNPSQWCQ